MLPRVSVRAGKRPERAIPNDAEISVVRPGAPGVVRLRVEPIDGSPRFWIDLDPTAQRYVLDSIAREPVST